MMLAALARNAVQAEDCWRGNKSAGELADRDSSADKPIRSLKGSRSALQ